MDWRSQGPNNRHSNWWMTYSNSKATATCQYAFFCSLTIICSISAPSLNALCFPLASISQRLYQFDLFSDSLPSRKENVWFYFSPQIYYSHVFLSNQHLPSGYVSLLSHFVLCIQRTLNSVILEMAMQNKDNKDHVSSSTPEISNYSFFSPFFCLLCIIAFYFDIICETCKL